MASELDSNDITIRLGVVALALILCVVGWRVMHPQTEFVADGLDSHWDAAVERSKASNQPALVLVTANWCPACKQLRSTVLSRDQVQSEISKHYTFMTLDISNPTDAQNQRAQKLGIKYIPTLIRYDRSGQESDRKNFLSEQAMLDWLREGE